MAQEQESGTASDSESTADVVGIEPEVDLVDSEATIEGADTEVAIEREESDEDLAVEEPSVEVLGSRQNPVPPGEQATFTVSAFGDANGSEWAIRVDGPDADITQAILAENTFNDAPAQGNVFLAVPVTVTLDSAGKEPLDAGLNFELDFFGRDSLSLYEGGIFSGCGSFPVLPPEFPEFDVHKDVFIGGSVSGHVCFEVTEADAASGVMVTINEDEPLFLATP